MGKATRRRGGRKSIPGTLTRPAVDRAVFAPAEIPVELVFEPAPGAKLLLRLSGSATRPVPARKKCDSGAQGWG